MEIILAIAMGLAFGFVLQKAGAANPEKIINMLRLRDFHLAKAILFAIGASSLVLFALLALGVAPVANLSVKSAYIGVAIGGLLLGIGWAVAGFCPGTSLVAAGAGRKDAISFILGGLAGAALYMVVYAQLSDSVLFQSIGGKSTLAATGDESYPALVGSVPSFLVAGVIGLVLIAVAFKLPQRRATA